MKQLSRELLDFIRRSPSCFHVVENLKNELLAAGYAELRESECWGIKPGGKYFVTRNGSSIIAFRVPEKVTGGFVMSASHSDSPSFKLKETAERRSAGCTQLSTEGYGGMLMATWFDRPLSVAGRVFVREGGKMVQKLVDIDRDLLIIPSVAIHMNRGANEGTKLLANVDTLPLYGGAEAGGIMPLAAASAGVAEDDILGKDLFLYCRTPGTVLGAEGEFIASPKLDDLECAFGCFRGFLAAEERGTIPVCCVFDNEEVGSATKQGAGSVFLRDTLRRIIRYLHMGEEDYQSMLARSFLVSADNAHAQHPNHPEYADRDNSPVLNGGVVVKFNANQRYTTDGRSAAIFRSICAEAGVPVQTFSNRSDLPGGSTLGSIANTSVPVCTVDIGMAQLAMHSAYETAGTADVGHLVRAMQGVYEADPVIFE